MAERNVSFGTEQRHYRNAIVAKDHERVVRISNDTRELLFQDAVQELCNCCAIDVFGCCHEVLPLSPMNCILLKKTDPAVSNPTPNVRGKTQGVKIARWLSLRRH